MSREGAPPAQWRYVNTQSGEQHKQLRLDRASHSATVVNESIYVIAGRTGSTFYSDLLRFDTSTRTWSILFAVIPNGFKPRANHTATLVGGRQIWVVAGSDNQDVFDDVHVLDVPSLTWANVRLRGDTSLLMRTAHSAELHPTDPRAILVFGGYGGAAASAFLNDLFVIRTNSVAVERVVVAGGVPPPGPRGYHSCTTLGSRCYVYGGRTEAGVVEANDMLAVFDAVRSCWVAPQVAGTWPQARSSHRAVALGNRLLIHGGAAPGDNADRLADVHTLLVCPATGRLTWCALDQPPGGAGAQGRPQGRSAHTVSLVGPDRLYVISGYVGARPGHHHSRYSFEVYMLLLGTPIGDPLPPLAPPPSPPRQPQQQQQQQPQTSPQPARQRSPRSPMGRSPTPTPAPEPRTKAVQGAPAAGAPNSAAAAAAPSAGTAAAAGGALSRPGHAPAGAPPPQPRSHTAAAPPQPPSRQGSRRLPTSAAVAADVPSASTTAAASGVEEDPIDLTGDVAPEASPAKSAGRRAQPLRGRTAAEATAALPAEGTWLGGCRRGRGGGAQLEPTVPRTGAAAATVAAGKGSVPAPAPPAAAAHEAAADGRPPKRQASDAAVAAVAATRRACGRLPVSEAPAQPAVTMRPQASSEAFSGGTAVQAQAPVGPNAAAVAAAAAAAIAAAGNGSVPQLSLQHATAPGSAVAAWPPQAELYGMPGAGSGPAAATIAAAATAAATAAMAATTAAAAGAPMPAPGSLPGGGGGGVYQRPPSPTHVTAPSPSHDAFMLVYQRQQEENQSLLRQLQSKEDAERRANQQLAALQEQQRRTEQELSTQRRSCEMTQAELRTANKELEEARGQLEKLQQDLTAARRQAAAAQQQHAAAAQQAAGREQSLLQEREATAAAHAEELRKWQEQAKSLEAAAARQRSEMEAYRRGVAQEEERQREAAAAQAERLKKSEAEVAELGAQLRAAVDRNQEQHEALRRAYDARAGLEREVVEARDSLQRLQRQLDEQVCDLTRQREALQLQVTHANNRLSSLEAELRSARDDITHRDAQHTALAKSHAERLEELKALHEQHRGATQRAEAARQQLAILQSHIQNMVSGAEAAAAVVARALAPGPGPGPGPAGA